MAKKALIVQGGWQEHDPEGLAEVFKKVLEGEDFSVEVSDTLDSFSNEEKLDTLDLIIPIWSMGSIGEDQIDPLSNAVEGGAGIAGCHGGMCDAFRENTEWQFMTGGQWVAHPGGDGIEHRINIQQASSSSIVEGIEDFTITTEQYYLHVDPAVDVLATTRFPVAEGPHASNGEVDVPVIWTKKWGEGRVFYCSLGHQSEIVSRSPVKELIRRGFLWAAKGE